MSDQNQYLRASTSQNLASAALSYSFAPLQNCQILEVNIHFSASISETVTLTWVSRDGTNYSTVVQVSSLSSQTDFAFRPTGHLILMDGDSLKVECTHAGNTGVAYMTIIAEPYGHQKAGSVTSPGV